VIAGVNILAADTLEQAQQHLETVRRTRAISLYGRRPGVDTSAITDEQADRLLASGLAAHVDEMLTFTAIGTATEVRTYLDGFAERTGADELITAHYAPGIEARLRSVEIAADAMDIATAQAR
jgi:alkanesulfonate monooxygenase SsuD/methylene tetrahydromethanopterin reductase-like flavin-dependent oxidoreductase (luciferase family)